MAGGRWRELGRQARRAQDPVHPGARRADHVYILAHGSKLGRAPFHAWATLKEGWTLVTDASAPAEQVRAFEARGVRVEVAGSG
ncbi:hypothetical protein ACIRLA_42145 [Streptomyces sp. NPDC102364]|uniref:hypothetical protein n=1 Tax=Streptomyces sp. NPDC102364 TaxID=3366161 RepID=UPI00381231F7